MERARDSQTGRRRRHAAALGVVHLLLLVAWPAAHAALPAHAASGEHDGQHRCPLCQNLQAGASLAPPAPTPRPAAVSSPTPLRAAPAAAPVTRENHDTAAPRAPPAA